MRDIWLQHGQRAATERVEEDPLAHPTLASGDGDARPMHSVCQYIHALHRHRLLDEERTMGGERLDELQRDRWMRVVDVDCHMHVRPSALPYRRKARYECFDARGYFQPAAGP